MPRIKSSPKQTKNLWDFIRNLAFHVINSRGEQRPKKALDLFSDIIKTGR